MRSRILVVETDPDERATLSLLLTQESYDVTSVCGGAAAEAVIHCDHDTDNEFDAIVCSTNMAGLTDKNGQLNFEGKFGPLPLIFISEMSELTDAGAFYGKPVLQKPISGFDLATAVREEVRKQKKRKTMRLTRKSFSNAS